jgi:hypothetical protein
MMMAVPRPTTWGDYLVRHRFVSSTLWAAKVYRRQHACVRRLMAAQREVMHAVDEYTDEDGGFTEATVMSSFVVSDLALVLWFMLRNCRQNTCNMLCNRRLIHFSRTGGSLPRKNLRPWRSNLAIIGTLPCKSCSMKTASTSHRAGG